MMVDEEEACAPFAEKSLPLAGKNREERIVPSVAKVNEKIKIEIKNENENLVKLP